MSAEWTLRLVRFYTEPETRWFWRVVLRRKLRYFEETAFSGPAPDGLKIVRSLNGGSFMSFPDAARMSVPDAITALEGKEHIA